MKQKTGRKLLGVLLALVLVLGLVPGMGLTAYAAPTETLLTTITATAKEQASYSTANVATVSFSYTAGGSSAYLANWGWWGYGWSATVNAAEGYTITKCIFYDDANRTDTDSSSPFVVETTEEDKTPRINGTPIDGGNYQSKGIKKIEVYGYATPVEKEETITINCQNDTLSAHGITNKLGANGTHGDFNDQGWIAWGQFIAPSGKVFTKIEVYGKEYEYDDETKKAWEWSGRAKIVSHDNFTDCEPYTSYIFTLDDLAPISQTVTFKVANGSWDDETTADKTVTLNGYEGDTLKLTADQIPAVGTKPGDTYKVGSWDVTPNTTTAITEATTYTYTYAQKDSISQTVTFKVVNGFWNDETTEDKTVTLTGYEGDTLKLAANQIPAVGGKPDDTYKAGSWDTTPSTDTEITAATTYTYTYAAKEASVVTKAPEVKTLTYNGSAQSLVTAGSAEGGEMQYALGNASEATQPYTTSIPTGTEAGT